jgi:putative aldouronate transport system permease protein
MENKIKNSLGMKIFLVFDYFILTFIALLCILPMIHILAVSFSVNSAANANLVKLWPVGFNLSSYKVVFQMKSFLNSFSISVERSILGTVISNVLTLLMAYPLSKSKEEFRGRNIYMWIVIFAMLFSGGLVPSYILVKSLGLRNSIWALVLPTAVPLFNVILVMNFIRQLPKEIEEAAFVDGASYFKCLIAIIVPLSKPVIATITLFSFVGHWNSWFDGLIFMDKVNMYPLQTYLQMILTSKVGTTLEQAKAYNDISDRTVKAAQIFVTMIPILAIYPFMQKYFITGIVVGSVKG